MAAAQLHGCAGVTNKARPVHLPITRDDVAVALLGWGQWTLWNTLFLLIIIQVILL